MSKIDRLNKQPSREDVLPYIWLLPERNDVFSPMQINVILASLTRLRDKNTDVSTFRHHVGHLTDYLLQAMLKLKIIKTKIITPLMKKTEGWEFEAPVVIFFINRAGLTMGLSAARDLPYGTPIGEFDVHRDEKNLEGILEDYNLPPDISGKTVLILDPMNAAGGSIECVWQVIKKEYLEKRKQKIAGVKIGNLISAPLGVAELKRIIPEAEIFTVSLDEYLTQPGETKFPPGYIIPGLGDAGDRQFGHGRSELFLGAQKMLDSFVNFKDPSRIRLIRK
ncbi:MAG: uracil phosphoribosyltransferase [Patescibacteria group bacterium]|nr:uracil phosphoribosyltransferase [Patescibacteria group bacterium]MCL5095345.1 uracil phosphoribosyltransferase [Patescibacteria group bacterium]